MAAVKTDVLVGGLARPPAAGRMLHEGGGGRVFGAIYHDLEAQLGRFGVADLKDSGQ